MPNIGSIINRLNLKKLNERKPSTETNCSCNPNECPLNGNCSVESVVYKATVHTADTSKFYLGMTERPIKIESLSIQQTANMKNTGPLLIYLNTYGP